MHTGHSDSRLVSNNRQKVLAPLVGAATKSRAMSHPTPLYLDAATVAACLPDAELFEVVARTMKALDTPDVVVGPTAMFGAKVDGVPLRMGSMSGCVFSQSAAGLKWFFVPGKARPRDVPHVPATIIVSSVETGMLDGIMDATFLTSERTAAMGVVAALACMRRPPTKAVVVGAGHIGRAVAKFLAAAAPTMERIEMATRKTNVEEVVRDADLVMTSTNVPVDSDLVCARWLKADAVVCSLGSAREVDLELVSQSWLVVHDVEHVRMRRSDLREGGAGWGRVAGDVANLMSGKLELPGDGTRIHVIVGSIGVLDVALGARALENARRRGLGVLLQGR